MDRREQAKQQQKQQMQMQRQSQSDNDMPQQPLFGVPVKVSHIISLLLLLFTSIHTYSNFLRESKLIWTF